MVKKQDEHLIRIKELGIALTQIAEEKGISKEKVMEITEVALAAAYKKDYGKRSQNIRADFDEKTGLARFFLVKEVVDETTREFVSEKEKEEIAVKEHNEKENKEKENKEEYSPMKSGEEKKIPRFNPERDILLKDARKIKKDIQLGEAIEEELESHSEFGRIAAQTAKQVIIQRIKEAEREAMFAEYKKKEGEVIGAVVQRIEGKNVFLDLGKSTGILFPSEQINGEYYRIGQRVKVYVVKVESDIKGPGILLSRTHPEMLKKLFELEVPEIFAGIVEIKAVSREPGSRSKIAVFSKDESVDPIGSCVGQKGTRVQTVIDELGGEKIDIIAWSENPEEFIKAALSPAKVILIEINSETGTAKVTVPFDQLSLAIGKRGQNVRLAAKLTGWKIDILGEENIEEKSESGSEEKETENISEKTLEEKEMKNEGEIINEDNKNKIEDEQSASEILEKEKK